MYTIEDYIKYYGNRDFIDVKWNIQDTLICSILSYLIFNSYDKDMYLYQFFDFYCKWQTFKLRNNF